MDNEQLQGYSILVVDDDPAIRDIYTIVFKNAGFSTYTANDGVEGLQQAKEHHPSIIILDIMMPNMDGRTMLSQLKADPTLQSIPVIMFSALITELEKSEMLAAGAVEYLEKSDVEDPDQLVETIKKVLHIGENK